MLSQWLPQTLEPHCLSVMCALQSLPIFRTGLKTPSFWPGLSAIDWHLVVRRDTLDLTWNVNGFDLVCHQLMLLCIISGALEVYDQIGLSITYFRYTRNSRRQYTFKGNKMCHILRNIVTCRKNWIRWRTKKWQDSLRIWEKESVSLSVSGAIKIAIDGACALWSK